jgi:tetratricopeptide (TPR) repeat protein
LYLNWLWAYIALGLLGPLCWLISDMKNLRQRKLVSNVALQRRRSALKRKSKVLKAVKKSPEDKLNTVIMQDAVPFINDMLNLPPGTTTSELSGKVEDSNLAQCLKNAGEASYLPGASNLNKKELRNKLYKALKKLTVITLFLLMPQLQALEGNSAEKLNIKEVKTEKSKSAIPANLDEAIGAYDSGDFDKAAAFFRSKIDKNAPDPALLYNLGSTLCSKGDLAGALVCFERARLLAPYDSAITENLNFVRRRLFLPEAGKIDGPTEMLIAASRSLRPDQWLLVAAFAWALAGIFLAFRRKLSTNKRIIFIGACGIIFLLAIAACIYEKTGIYSDSRAVVTASDAELRSLPSAGSGQKLARLRMGTVVKIIESRLQWVRIKSDDTKGWLLKDKITRIAPGNELPPKKVTKKSLNLKED